jgi:hypothetical protein
MKKGARAVRAFVSVTDTRAELVIIRNIQKLCESSPDYNFFSLTDDPLVANLILSNDLKLLEGRHSSDCQCVFVTGVNTGRIVIPSNMRSVPESDISSDFLRDLIMTV